MRQNYFFKAAFTLLMSGSLSMASAADIYVSNGAGSDTNNGLSAATPVKTISKAFTICLEGDVIHVMDMINVNQEPTKTTARTENDLEGDDPTKVMPGDILYTTWNSGTGTAGVLPHTRSITIIGNDKSTCGFDGNNTSCIIRQDHGGTGTATITYKNLTFKNGKSADNSGGGAVYVRLSNTTATGQAAIFENCDFIANKARTDKPGGAIAIVQQPGVVTFKQCRFAQNIASKGAGIYLERGTVTVDGCVFEDHDLSTAIEGHLTTTFPAASVGAGIHCNLAANAQTINLDVKNSLFRNNKVGANGAAFSTSETNPASVTSGTQNIKFTNCVFVNNTTTIGVGGAVYIHNINTGTTQNLTFVNSTFKGNGVGANSGAALALNSFLVNSQFNMINCTVSENKVAGNTGSGGAGVRFLKSSAAGIRRIQNCIIENNTAVDANSAVAADYADLGMEDIVNVDLTTTPSYNPGTTLIINNSLIGYCNNANFATQFPSNNLNYVFELNGSIANTFAAKLGTFDENKYVFPLLVGSPAIAYGNTSFLKDLTPSIITDQLGTRRPWVNCSAGAFEFTDASALKTNSNGLVTVFSNSNNQLVVRNSANLSGFIMVYNMMGQLVESSPISATFHTLNKRLSQGNYLIKVNLQGETTSQKINIK